MVGGNVRPDPSPLGAVQGPRAHPDQQAHELCQGAAHPGGEGEEEGTQGGGGDQAGHGRLRRL